MEKKYSAFGGMFKMRISTSDETSKLDEEEISILKEEYDDLKGELNDLKKIIDANSLETKKVKKHKTIKEILNDSEIPYEVRMLHLIKAYRKDQEKWGKMAEYAKHLEEEVIRLKDILIKNGFADPGVIDDVKPAQLITELRKEIMELKEKLKLMKKAVNDPEGVIKLLEERIANTYPQRVHKLSSYKKVIKSQEDYIKVLQKLLDENGIKYHDKCPINDIEANGADAIDENAVRD